MCSRSENARTHLMPRTAPPFRADHVGSLLRTAALREARGRRERGEIDAAALKAVEDEEIIKLIGKQQDVGLNSITDGEYRRASWQTDFLVGLDGVESYHGERKFKFQGPQPRPILLRLKGKLGGFSGHPMIDHFRFLAKHTKATPKMTIPSPSSLHFRYGREGWGRRSIRRWAVSIALSVPPTAGWCAPSRTPAAAISSSTRSTSPICAIRRCATRSAPGGVIPTRCPSPM